MQQFAEGWVVPTVASSALALAMVNVAALIPILIMTPFGVVADSHGAAQDTPSYQRPGRSSPALARLVHRGSSRHRRTCRRHREEQSTFHVSRIIGPALA